MAPSQVNVGIVKLLFSLSSLSLILEVVGFLFVCMVWFSLVLCLLVFFKESVRCCFKNYVFIFLFLSGVLCRKGNLPESNYLLPQDRITILARNLHNMFFPMFNGSAEDVFFHWSSEVTLYRWCLGLPGNSSYILHFFYILFHPTFNSNGVEKPFILILLPVCLQQHHLEWGWMFVGF